MQIKQEDTIIIGRHPVEEALKGAVSIDKILLQQGVRGDFEKTVRHSCKAANIPLQIVPRERLAKLTRGNHQGVIAYVSPVTFQRLEDVIPKIYESGQIPLLIVLDGVTDVRNLGAIARSAEVLGAHALVISSRKSAQINADTVKASAGAILRLDVCREQSLTQAAEYLAQCGIKIIAGDLSASTNISEMDLTIPLAMVAGSEGEGVSKAILELVDEKFRIPQIGTIDSLNVSVAVGIMLYETVRQRGSTGK